MKKFATTLFFCLAVVGCSGGMNDGCAGWKYKDVTGSGQVKRVWKNTPIFCPDFYEVDVSLGVMRNGIGSMSTHDVVFFIEEKNATPLKEAAERGALIDFTYDVRRTAVCVDEQRLTSFKVQQ